MRGSSDQHLTRTAHVEPSIAHLNSTLGGSFDANELVRAIRAALAAESLPPGVLRSGLRINEVAPMQGGLKSALVAGVTLSLAMNVKVAFENLDHHAELMDVANGAVKTQGAMFPRVIAVVRPLSDDRPYLMLQEQLLKFTSVFDVVYRTGDGHLALESLERARLMLGKLHKVDGVELAANTKPNPDPFSARIESKLAECKATYGWPIRVNGQGIPDIQTLSDRVRRVSQTSPLGLCHGDPHLANILARRRGKNAISVRFIDPNPSVGHAPAIYDWGKLVHFADVVGWAKQGESHVSIGARRGHFTVGVSSEVPPRSEKARQVVYRALIPDEAVLSHEERVAIASAHLGMATAGIGPAATISSSSARFAFLRALEILGAIT